MHQEKVMIQYTMTLEFEEAVFGTKKKSQFVKM